MSKLEEMRELILPYDCPTLDFEGEQKWALQRARAIIECLMEPDEAMYKGYENAQNIKLLDMALSDPRGVIKSDWQAMLRAILDEQA